MASAQSPVDTWACSGSSALHSLLEPDPSPFGLLHRPGSTGADHLELVTGTVATVPDLEGLPVPPAPPTSGSAGHDLLVLLPYRQLLERGFSCHDDGEPILALSVEAQTRLTRKEVVDALPAHDVQLADGSFDLDDHSYARIVEQVLSEEIGAGAGSNFVIHRPFTAEVTGEPLSAALALFRTLLLDERGAYWTFVVHTGARTFVGATPERHVSLSQDTLVMNPISGTLRYPETGPAIPDVLSFLADQKEAEELLMVVDEELKMMSRICDGSVRVVGPHLKEMGRLAHTEYLLEGSSSRGICEILRETMFAPTVIGSPLENATRVVARHEPVGRAYYSGVIGLIGHDETGLAQLDSSILIRTAELHHNGTLRMGVGATLVRGSEPGAEIRETKAKAAGLLSATTSPSADAKPDTRMAPQEATRPAPSTKPRRRPAGLSTTILEDHPQVRAALTERNTTLSRYWLGANDCDDPSPGAALHGARGLLVDAEDTFTDMLCHQLAELGMEVPIRRHDDVKPEDLNDFDVVILGPGPGDPRAADDPKIAKLRKLAGALLADSIPFLAVCLGHQVVSSLLGLPIVPLLPPNQGTQQQIDLFDRLEHVGFYNTFVARCGTDAFQSPACPGRIEVSRDPETGNVHGLRGSGFASLQFHAESVLTQNGHRLLGDILARLQSHPSVSQPQDAVPS